MGAVSSRNDDREQWSRKHPSYLASSSVFDSVASPEAIKLDRPIVAANWQLCGNLIDGVVVVWISTFQLTELRVNHAGHKVVCATYVLMRDVVEPPASRLSECLGVEEQVMPANGRP